MKMKAIIKSILSCLAFIFMTQAISSVSIYSLFIVAILYCAYTEIGVKRNVVTIVVSVVLSILSIFYLLNGSINNISLLVKDVFKFAFSKEGSLFILIFLLLSFLFSNS